MAKIAVLLVIAFGTTQAQQANHVGGASMAFTLTSPAFAAGAEIPPQYTCKGADISPALEWSGAPAHTVSFALIMDDPDAPAGTWVHWVVWNMPASVHSLPAGVPKHERLSDGTQQGRNSFRKTGYGGPCPPGGATHRYFFRLYALDSKLNLAAGADRAQLDEAMQGHVLAQTEYMGTFHK
ncbi:MAG TPA: YbhB/YbcL family Raf kinase inhibitor-like protein [Terriglobales bacterium]|nr:YbhB/YbcL family Raf kinase inhibitor-like protein [Terriglobales bacterium]